MSTLAFRNVAASPSDPVETWPYEALVAAIERGSLSDWRRVAAAIRRAPWGKISRWVSDYAGYGESAAVADLLLQYTHRARDDVRERDRQEVAARVRRAISRSGLSASAFAAECGTSATRLSTYASGKVQPAAALLIRFERTAQCLESQRSAPDNGAHMR